MELATASRFGVLSPEWDRLPRNAKLEMMGFEQHRRRAAHALVEQMPEKDWGRNLAIVLADLL